MSNILNPKDVTGSTRFIFDFDITNSMLIQLMKEFGGVEEQEFRQEKSGGAKFINYKSKKAIEINRNFISFSPILNIDEKESVRKRIYKHVAKKSEVYTKNSFENMDLAKSSLLTEELRSCASLLYYSFHKFFNGRLYRFLNERGIEDHQIIIDEMEHYTSAIFYKFNEKWIPEVEDVTIENYLEVLCTTKKLAVNPYVLKKYFFNESSELLNYIEPYIVFLIKKLTNKDIYEKSIYKEFKEELNIFSKKAKKDRTQEMEVKAAISQCIVNSIDNPEDKLLWYIYIVSLRLYWLRQTADYDFDFEVNTSVREMSLLVNVVNNILRYILKEEILKEDHKMDDTMSFQMKHISSKRDEEEHVVSEDDEEEDDDEELAILMKEDFVIDRDFPNEINFQDSITMYATKIHIDSYFNKEEIINALNFTPNVSNQGKFFIYPLKEKFDITLFIHINDDGRWTFWLSEEPFNNLKESDLTHSIDIFMRNFNNTYIDFYSKNFTAYFISTKPILRVENDITTSSSEIIKLFEDFYKSRDYISQRTLPILSELLGFKVFEGSLWLKDNIEISLNITTSFNWYGIHSTSSLPRMFFDGAKSENNHKKIYIDLFLREEEMNVQKSANIFKVLKSRYEKNINEKSCFFGSQAIGISAKELDKVFLGDKVAGAKIKESFGIALNEVAFFLLDQNVADNNVINIIEESIRLLDNQSFPIATKGRWYFKNLSLPVEEAYNKGNELYREALLLEKNLESKYFKAMFQRYILELCIFQIVREENLDLASSLLIKALGIGEEVMFYDDAVAIKEEYFDDIKINEIEKFEIEEFDFDEVVANADTLKLRN